MAWPTWEETKTKTIERLSGTFVYSPTVHGQWEPLQPARWAGVDFRTGINLAHCSSLLTEQMRRTRLIQRLEKEASQVGGGAVHQGASPGRVEGETVFFCNYTKNSMHPPTVNSVIIAEFCSCGHITLCSEWRQFEFSKLRDSLVIRPEGLMMHSRY